MTTTHTPADLRQALDDVSASSAGGAPFLIAFGTTFVIAALLAFVLPRPVAAMVAMFQGAVALPAALWLERRLGWRRMTPANPLHALSAQLAMSQNLALPAWIVAYSLNPGAVPVVMAATGAAHFLPYAWLHRSRAYTVVAVALSVGTFGLQLGLGAAAFPYILLFVAVVYWSAVPFVYRRAGQLVGREPGLASGEAAA